MKIIKSTAPIGGVFQIELKWFNLKTVLEPIGVSRHTDRDVPRNTAALPEKSRDN